MRALRPSAFRLLIRAPAGSRVMGSDREPGLLMSESKRNPFGARSTLRTAEDDSALVFELGRLEKAGLPSIARLPFSLRVLLEAVLRNCDGKRVSEEDVETLARWQPRSPSGEVPFLPARVVLQDFTGVPTVVDLAAMRSAMQRLASPPDRRRWELP